MPLVVFSGMEGVALGRGRLTNKLLSRLAINTTNLRQEAALTDTCYALDVLPDGAVCPPGASSAAAPVRLVHISDPRVSRLHAVLWPVWTCGHEGQELQSAQVAGATAPLVMLEDHSTNGTFLNGALLPTGVAVQLADGDRISLVQDEALQHTGLSFVFRGASSWSGQPWAPLWPAALTTAADAEPLQSPTQSPRPFPKSTSQQQQQPSQEQVWFQAQPASPAASTHDADSSAAKGDAHCELQLSVPCDDRGCKPSAAHKPSAAPHDTSSPRALAGGSLHSYASIDELMDEVQCPICLGVLSCAVALQPCGHSFCAGCVSQHLAAQLQAGLALSCPLRCPDPERVVIDEAARVRRTVLLLSATAQCHNNGIRAPTLITQRTSLDQASTVASLAAELPAGLGAPTTSLASESVGAQQAAQLHFTLRPNSHLPADEFLDPNEALLLTLTAQAAASAAPRSNVASTASGSTAARPHGSHCSAAQGVAARVANAASALGRLTRRLATRMTAGRQRLTSARFRASRLSVLCLHSHAPVSPPEVAAQAHQGACPTTDLYPSTFTHGLHTPGASPDRPPVPLQRRRSVDLESLLSTPPATVSQSTLGCGDSAESVAWTGQAGDHASIDFGDEAARGSSSQVSCSLPGARWMTANACAHHLDAAFVEVAAADQQASSQRQVELPDLLNVPPICVDSSSNRRATRELELHRQNCPIDSDTPVIEARIDQAAADATFTFPTAQLASAEISSPTSLFPAHRRCNSSLALANIEELLATLPALRRCSSGRANACGEWEACSTPRAAESGKSSPFTMSVCSDDEDAEQAAAELFSGISTPLSSPRTISPPQCRWPSSLLGGPAAREPDSLDSPRAAPQAGSPFLPPEVGALHRGTWGSNSALSSMCSSVACSEHNGAPEEEEDVEEQSPCLASTRRASFDFWMRKRCSTSGDGNGPGRTTDMGMLSSVDESPPQTGSSFTSSAAAGPRRVSHDDVEHACEDDQGRGGDCYSCCAATSGSETCSCRSCLAARSGPSDSRAVDSPMGHDLCDPWSLECHAEDSGFAYEQLEAGMLEGHASADAGGRVCARMEDVAAVSSFRMALLCPLDDEYLPLDLDNMQFKQAHAALMQLQRSSVAFEAGAVEGARGRAAVSCVAGLEVLSRLAWNCDDVRDMMTHHGGPRIIVSTMEAFPDYEGLQSNACLALMALVRGQGDRCHAIQWAVAKSGGLEAMCAAMERFSSSSLVQLSALLAAVPLVLDNTMMQAHMCCGGLPVMMAALDNHVNEAHIQTKGLVLMGAMMQGEDALHDAMRGRCLELGLPRRVAAALAAHASNDDVLWGSVFALATLVRDESALLRSALCAIKKAGLPALLCAGLDAYRQRWPASSPGEDMLLSAGAYLEGALAQRHGPTVRRGVLALGLALVAVVTAATALQQGQAWRSRRGRRL